MGGGADMGDGADIGDPADMADAAAEGGARGRHEDGGSLERLLVKIRHHGELEAAQRRQAELEEEVRELSRKLGGGGCQPARGSEEEAMPGGSSHLSFLHVLHQPVLHPVCVGLAYPVDVLYVHHQPVLHSALFGWQMEEEPMGKGEASTAGGPQRQAPVEVKLCKRWNDGKGWCILPGGACLMGHLHQCCFLDQDGQMCAVEGCALWHHLPEAEVMSLQTFCSNWNHGNTNCMIADGTCRLRKKHGCSFRHPGTQKLCASKGCALWQHFGRGVAGDKGFSGDSGHENEVDGDGKYDLLARWQHLGKEEMDKVRKWGWHILPVLRQKQQKHRSRDEVVEEDCRAQEGRLRKSYEAGKHIVNVYSSFCKHWNQGSDWCILPGGRCRYAKKHGCNFTHPGTSQRCEIRGCARWRHLESEEMRIGRKAQQGKGQQAGGQQQAKEHQQQQQQQQDQEGWKPALRPFDYKPSLLL